jgi:hypothetical protein
MIWRNERRKGGRSSSRRFIGNYYLSRGMLNDMILKTNTLSMWNSEILLLSLSIAGK